MIVDFNFPSLSLIVNPSRIREVSDVFCDFSKHFLLDEHLSVVIV